ncbi:hypothetical protein [Streptomyces sp. NPDC052693]|uniref:hypothetical protein n=1 Tax=Streptomyces sp. NPDC052693 TaxID=3155814 RepID=UPI00343FCED7
MWKSHAEETIISSAWTPQVRRLRREFGRPVRILKIMGLRADESRDRADHSLRNVLINSARVVGEWLPVQDWPSAAVFEWHQDAPVVHHWTENLQRNALRGLETHAGGGERTRLLVSGRDLTDLNTGLRDDEQRRRVREVIHDRLADDRDPQEDTGLGEHVWNFADPQTSNGVNRVDGSRKGIFARDRRGPDHRACRAHPLDATWGP